MILKRLQLSSPWIEPTNCYVIQDEESKETMVIDPAGELEKITEMLEILEADSRVDDDDLIHVGKLEFKILHTPGHTNCSTSLYCKEHKMLFSGDTIFRGTWGRTDLKTSSFEDIIKSITEKLMVLPEDTIVYPGHGKSTMIGEEKPIYLELHGKEY